MPTWMAEEVSSPILCSSSMAIKAKDREKLGIHQHKNHRESCSDNPRIMVCSEKKKRSS